MENWHLERLRDSDAEFRAVAAKSLALDVGHEAAVQLLLDIFIERESSHEDRVSALSGLAELGRMGSVIDVLLQAPDMDALSVTFASSEVADRVGAFVLRPTEVPIARTGLLPGSARWCVYAN